LKPTVLQLVDSFNRGGSELQALQLTRLLHESGSFNVRLSSLGPEGPLRSDAEALNIGDIPSFPLNSFYDLNALLQLSRLVTFLRKSRIDILHTHDFYTNIFGMAAATLARVPIRIASMRETIGMRSSAQERVQRFAYQLAHHVVGNSEAVRSKLIEQGIKQEKISVIYNGLDMKRLASPTRAEALSLLGISKEVGRSQKFVTILANLRHEVKDHPTFLRAAQIVHSRVPESAFLLAGEGNLSNQMQALATELGIEKSTYFLGRCDNVGALLKLSDVCVLSSKGEGFANAILEYMAAARPVVATEVGGAVEIITEGITGFLVPSGDHGAMASRIIDVLQDPVMARAMGEEGRRVVETKFSCANQLRSTAELYIRLLIGTRSKLVSVTPPSTDSD